MFPMRKVKREVKIGTVAIGANNPVAVQTMLNVPAALRLAGAGVRGV